MYFSENDLLKAAKEGEIRRVKACIETGVNINTSGKTALHYASENGHTEIVRLLLENGAHINARYSFDPDNRLGSFKSTPLKTIKLLLGIDLLARQKKDKIIGTGIAFKKGVGEPVTFLIKKGARVKKSTRVEDPWIIGTTALHLASENGHTEIVRLLLEKGAKVEVKNTEGFTPLYRAFLKGHKDIVKLLRKTGARRPLVPMIIYRIINYEF